MGVHCCDKQHCLLDLAVNSVVKHNEGDDGCGPQDDQVFPPPLESNVELVVEERSGVVARQGAFYEVELEEFGHVAENGAANDEYHVLVQ